MTLTFRIALIISAVIFIAIILSMIKRGRLSVKYSIVWICAALVMLLFACFPYIVMVMRDLLKMEVVSNLIFLLAIAFTIFIVLWLCSEISTANSRINRLCQTNALLEKRVRELEEKEKSDKSHS